MMAKQEKTKTILIIDDAPVFLLSMAEIVGMQGYNVVTAEDGLQGWRQFKKVKPDLVSTGIVMPGINGVELIKRIREVDSRVPIVIVTGGGYSLDLIRLSQKPESYAHAVLQKPVDIDDFFELIAHLLKNAL
jgi:DNA-binding NtrC family response regulator